MVLWWSLLCVSTRNFASLPQWEPTAASAASLYRRGGLTTLSNTLDRHALYSIFHPANAQSRLFSNPPRPALWDCIRALPACHHTSVAVVDNLTFLYCPALSPAWCLQAPPPFGIPDLATHRHILGRRPPEARLSRSSKGRDSRLWANLCTTGTSSRLRSYTAQLGKVKAWYWTPRRRIHRPSIAIGADVQGRAH